VWVSDIALYCERNTGRGLRPNMLLDTNKSKREEVNEPNAHALAFSALCVALVERTPQLRIHTFLLFRYVNLWTIVTEFMIAHRTAGEDLPIPGPLLTLATITPVTFSRTWHIEKLLWREAVETERGEN
jgi:hypothetical protein